MTRTEQVTRVVCSLIESGIKPYDAVYGDQEKVDNIELDQYPTYYAELAEKIVNRINK